MREGLRFRSPTAVADVDLAALDFDLIYLEAMIPHIQNSIDMAIVVHERSGRAEMTAFTVQELQNHAGSGRRDAAVARGVVPGYPGALPITIGAGDEHEACG